MALCKNEGCEKKAYCRKMCRNCYERWKYREKKENGGAALRSYGVEGCRVEGCTALHEAQGLCHPHYDKWRVHGDPLARTRKDPSLIEARGDHLAVVLGGEKAAGRVTLVSCEDRGKVEGHSWWAPGGPEASDQYAAGKPGGRRVPLHRWLLGLAASDPRQGDHINGDRLDNRRENLRIVTFAEQMQNKKPWGTSGHRNVYWEADKRLWRVLVTKDGKKHSGGRHKELEDAVEAAKTLRAQLLTHHVEGRCVRGN